jgi:hypothetical protein
VAIFTSIFSCGSSYLCSFVGNCEMIIMICSAKQVKNLCD